MENKNDGGAAFPFHYEFPQDCNPTYMINSYGMSLRDWFAGMALQGQLGAPSLRDCTEEGIAKYAYIYADAMIAARGE